MKSVSKTLDRALEGVPIPDTVYLPPAVADSKMKFRGTPENYALSPNDMRDRIQKECDPIGQLIALANGMPVATVTIEKDGSTTVKYETANLGTRIKILESLRDKLIPNMSAAFKPKEKDHGQDDWDDLQRRRSAQFLATEPE